MPFRKSPHQTGIKPVIHGSRAVICLRASVPAGISIYSNRREKTPTHARRPERPDAQTQAVATHSEISSASSVTYASVSQFAQLGLALRTRPHLAPPLQSHVWVSQTLPKSKLARVLQNLELQLFTRGRDSRGLGVDLRSKKIHLCCWSRLSATFEPSTVHLGSHS